MGRATATLLCGVAVLAALTLLGLSIAGYRVQPVLSGSMEPVMPVGSAVVAKAVPAKTVRVGDVITFNHPRRKGARVTHRVVAVQLRGAVPYVRTKGDANRVPDDWNVGLPGTVGRKVGDVPRLGYVMNAFAQPQVRGLAIACFTLVLLVLLLRRIWGTGDPVAAAAPESRRAGATAYGTPW